MSRLKMHVHVSGRGLNVSVAELDIVRKRNQVMSDCQGWRKHALDVRQLDLYFCKFGFYSTLNLICICFRMSIVNLVNATKNENRTI